MPSLVRHVGRLRDLNFRLPKSAGAHPKIGIPNPPCRTETVALSIEFVAKPEKARSAATSLPNAIIGSLKEVAGFSGCMVMSSEHEARLITVITFWSGNDCHRRCSENVRWVRALISGYVDRHLRVQTLLAHAPLTSDSSAETFSTETNDAETGLILRESVPAPADETVCVA